MQKITYLMLFCGMYMILSSRHADAATTLDMTQFTVPAPRVDVIKAEVTCGLECALQTGCTSYQVMMGSGQCSVTNSSGQTVSAEWITYTLKV